MLDLATIAHCAISNAITMGVCLCVCLCGIRPRGLSEFNPEMWAGWGSN